MEKEVKHLTVSTATSERELDDVDLKIRDGDIRQRQVRTHIIQTSPRGLQRRNSAPQESNLSEPAPNLVLTLPLRYSKAGPSSGSPTRQQA